MSKMFDYPRIDLITFHGGEKYVRLNETAYKTFCKDKEVYKIETDTKYIGNVSTEVITSVTIHNPVSPIGRGHFYVYVKETDFPEWKDHVQIDLRYASGDFKIFSDSHYRIDVDWDEVQDTLERTRASGCAYVTQPIFQRGLVWTEEEKISYIENILRGCKSGKEIYWNCTSWNKKMDSDILLVDGQQRINAVLEFCDNKIKIFDKYYFSNIKFLPSHCRFSWNINTFETDKEVLEWYLFLNTSTKAHTKEELDKVREMLRNL